MTAADRTGARAARTAFWCSFAYGAMKLDWALGGAVLARQTPLPPAARAQLLERAGNTVTEHRLSVALAVVGMAAALHLRGRFGPHGGVRRAVLLAGAWAGCAFMVARAVGLLGYGFTGDLWLLVSPGLRTPCAPGPRAHPGLLGPAAVVAVLAALRAVLGARGPAVRAPPRSYAADAFLRCR